MAALQDGYRTLVTFALNPNLAFWEKRVTPHGVDFGGGIDTTTMRNSFLRTMTPKSLAKLTDMSIQVAWNPTLYLDAYAIMAFIQLVTTTFPDGSQLRVMSWLDKFIPAEMVEGEQPMAAFTVIAANTNGPPNWTEVSATFIAANNPNQAELHSGFN